MEGASMAKLLTQSGKYNAPQLLKFVSGLMAPEDPVLRRIRLETPKRGLPPINIGPDEGKILDFLVRACGARKALEVGTLAGYSACWIARALPEDGVLYTLEYEPKHAAVARENIQAAGLSQKITVLIVLHDLNLSARFCDELLLLDQGRIVSSGSPQSVLTPENLNTVFHIQTRVENDASYGKIQVRYTL